MFNVINSIIIVLGLLYRIYGFKSLGDHPFRAILNLLIPTFLIPVYTHFNDSISLMIQKVASRVQKMEYQMKSIQSFSDEM